MTIQQVNGRKPAFYRITETGFKIFEYWPEDKVNRLNAERKKARLWAEQERQRQLQMEREAKAKAEAEAKPKYLPLNNGLLTEIRNTKMRLMQYELAEQLGVEAKQFSNWTNAGKIPYEVAQELLSQFPYLRSEKDLFVKIEKEPKREKIKADVPLLKQILRQELGITKAQLAKETGITVGTLDYWSVERHAPEDYLDDVFKKYPILAEYQSVIVKG